ncbi:DinB family protein [Metabacillus sp. GX 13764]|uniref:DinB family protein n=1 Tax=Metabacillus kandeliae TaxID=2900151 RepID=UPI001E2E2CC4|nr:DinB family protein [Metabacillus kandeliae]MCD7034383.1 DinB family protein [Metabacillus kandeliae]
MFQTVNSFLNMWELETDRTQKVMDRMTDDSLKQVITPENWSLGRLAWHIAVAPKGIAARAGLQVEGLKHDNEVPESAALIANEYKTAAKQVAEAVENQWTDEILLEERPFFEMILPAGMHLYFIIQHQTHHRGQMTVLMRQAGIQVPGVYGPSKEEWALAGMEAPR